MKPYLTKSELAEAISISESTVDEMVRRGVLPPPIDLAGFKRWKWDDARHAWANRTRIYVLRCGEFVKIGISQNVAKRVDHLRRANPYEVELIADFYGSLTEEAMLHVRFKAHRHRLEWFRHEGELAEWIKEGCPL